jgi:cobalt-zinc-cadmium efflux system outer membrane protein
MLKCTTLHTLAFLAGITWISAAQAQAPRQIVLRRLPPTGAEELPAVPPGYEIRRVERVFNLRSLSDLAMVQHPILQRAGAEIESAKGDRVQAALYPNPRFETNNPAVFAGRTSQMNFGFQQDMVTKGKIRLEKAAADQQVRKIQASFELERMQLLTELRTQYYVTLAAKERVRVNEEFVRISEQALTTAEKLVDAGTGSTTDVLLITTELERARVQFENSKVTLASELKQLAATSGAPDLLIKDLEGSIFDRLPAYDEEQIREFLIAQSIRVEMGQAEITRTQMKLRREEVEPYPNIRFGPAYAVNTDTNRGQFWLSMVFDIPLFDLNQGKIRQARAEVHSAAADLDVTRTNMIKNLADVSGRHANARTTVDRLQNKILPNAKRAQTLVQEGFDKGIFDVNRVLQARRSLLEVTNDLIDASEKAWSTAAELSGQMQREQFP